MEKRDFADMIIYFCQKVSEMNISKKNKIELLGMIIAIETKHDELMPKWIPVTERLPEYGERVLTTTEVGSRGKKVRSGTYTKSLFQCDNGDVWTVTDKEVIAWMPLPEPYRKEN